MGVGDTLSFFVCLFVCLFIPLHCILNSDIFKKKEDSTNSGNAFQNSFQPDWQIDVVFGFLFCFVLFLFFFNRAIMARTQIWVHRWRAQDKDFGAVS